MSTCLAASAELDKENIIPSLIEDSRWVFIEGYVVANGDPAREAITKLIKQAKSSNTKLAITMSDAFVVNGFRDFLSSILPEMDLIFCNEVEALSLAEVSELKNAFEHLSRKYKGVVVTCGAGGAHISYENDVGHVASFACEPVDLTGAGDAFAGAFLHGINGKLSPFAAGKQGCFYASKVIQQWGARLRADISSLKREFADTQG
jgi:sugar/nucleoside kinase (ribokinase family)